MSVEVTYPPLDTLKPAAEDIWIVDSGPLRVAGLIPLPVRMTVIRLAGGSLLLHSPTRFEAALKRQMDEIGPITHIVAPNSAHWSFVKEWQHQVPDAITWAAPGLRERRQVQKSGVRLDHDLRHTNADRWPTGLEQIHVPGIGGFCEVCLFHRRSSTLILTDLVQNFEPAKLPLTLRPIAALAGITAPDGRAPVYLRAIVRAKGEAAKAAARHMLALKPDRVIFTHGRWFESDAAARLERSLRWLTQ
ncbi:MULTISPECIES: DUF4336 domain-containing protein [unclassified Chelatococcus]|uniref:DUF4336 domain-containing protein n=1 Tax=unclassified Chelatococcus TaxID=2638111 RepID=UPI001BCD3B45|nr:MULTISPECIES: DUF4336 domain-containing protein [unclassified Chelatococcus]MBS7700402.1 DUF4336 domain-containing protein [Chelatococcus sp. YT9]MBX3556198.1 DUF4336 domain-containing protein [Chelatococcus sp.]